MTRPPSAPCCRNFRQCDAFERVYALADIRRATSLGDVRMQVHIAHTKSRFSSRFFIEMQRPTDHTHWNFGVSMDDIRHFEARALKLVKKHHKKHKRWLASSPSDNDFKTAVTCDICTQLHQEMKKWHKIPHLHALKYHNNDEKCSMVMKRLYDMLRIVYTRSEWLHTCDLLWDLLRMVEDFCHIEYYNDRDALRILKTLRCIPPPHLHSSAGTRNQRTAEDNCSICLNSLHCQSYLGDCGRVTAVELDCGHQFHDTCISKWFHTRLNCPLCRSEREEIPHVATN